MNRQEAKRALSQWIKSARQKLAITQDELGAQLKCSGVHISQMERGRRMPSNEILLKIIRILACDRKEIRGLFFLRVRASSDLTADDFEKVCGDAQDMNVVAGDPTYRFISLVEKAESTLSLNQFRLLKNAVRSVIDFAKEMRN